MRYSIECGSDRSLTYDQSISTLIILAPSVGTYRVCCSGRYGGFATRGGTRRPRTTDPAGGAGSVANATEASGAVYHLMEETLQDLLTTTVREALSKAKAVAETRSPLHPRRLFETTPLKPTPAPSASMPPVYGPNPDQTLTGVRARKSSPFINQVLVEKAPAG
ncbi:hypothetical protein Salat_2490400 [Sesamum alatum]|uniref:Uncharacterized protein n=1 Tax=Sesamum alatum TaxID=300844 RepID=A0AAE1XRF2_9LAMI|nr:hypothetical protein Salat_2490400 [Sesamum alatum]